jgi:hypothetical protein
MTYTPTDEQVKRGAAELMRDDPEYENGTYGPADYEAMARAVLVAVGPSIAAQALRDAAGDTAQDDSGADDWYASWLNDRADQIEQEARRG